MSEAINIAVAVLLIIASVSGVVVYFKYRRLEKENEQLRDDIITMEEAKMRRLEGEGRIRTREYKREQEVQQ